MLYVRPYLILKLYDLEIRHDSINQNGLITKHFFLSLGALNYFKWNQKMSQ